MPRRCIAWLMMCVLTLPTVGAYAVAASKPTRTKAKAAARKASGFVYDKADEVVPAKPLAPAGEQTYDASIAADGAGLWVTWLQFSPGTGDVVLVARYQNGELLDQRQVTPEIGTYANPTLTFSGDECWLTYEAERDGDWDIFAVALPASASARIIRISEAKGPDIQHVVAPDPNGGLWVAWQSGERGDFDIVARHVTAEGAGPVQRVSESPAGNWQPAMAVAGDGTAYIVWDSYDGESYNVYLRTGRDGSWDPTVAVADTPAFEGHVQVQCDPHGRAWILWEEGGVNWGRAYRAKHHPGFNIIKDDYGPLHRFRRLRLAVFDEAGGLRNVAPALPMPSIDAALARKDTGHGKQAMGAFYERGRLMIDPAGKVWVAYRHRYVPWLGVEPLHHLDSGWGLYARCLTAEGWSRLYRFDGDQGDGMQRLDLTWTHDGLAAVWTSGRTDRRTLKRPRGVFVARLDEIGGSPPDVAKLTQHALATQPARKPQPRATPPVVNVGGKEYGLYFGDLHRHTDLSLCFPPSDGTIDDAYRFAIDVAGLDFLGITDHTHDLVMGDGLSQVWWRSRKEVTRHQLPGTFFPFFSYERSRGDTDHNVISLSPDMLRPHTYPLPEFWKELDNDTLTIPHQPFKAVTWDRQDAVHRPLLEIYQGFRDVTQEKEALVGLAKGYLLGLIASSDHLSTNASFAAVWSPDRDRESIFRSMQARRTYAATARICVDVRADGHWMGESFDAAAAPAISIHVIGTDTIDRAEVYHDGEVEQSLPCGGRELTTEYHPRGDLKGVQFYWLRIHQTDGNQAWSSPIWMRLPE